MFLILSVLRGFVYDDCNCTGGAPGLRDEGTSPWLSAGQRLRPYTSPENIPQPVSWSFLPPGIYPDPLFLDHEWSLWRLKPSVRTCWFSEFDWFQIPFMNQWAERRLAVSQHLWKLESSGLSLVSAIDLKRKKPNSLGVSHLVQLTESNRDSS